MRNTVALLFALLSFTPFVYSQEEHEHASTELGLSLAYVWLDEHGEEETAAAAHLHFVKMLDGSAFLERLGVDLGFETIFADHVHHTLMAGLVYRPTAHLSLSVSPGIVFVKEEGEWENHYATHVELSYGFEVGEYEIGPVVGWADSEEGSHHMVGLHFGIPF